MIARLDSAVWNTLLRGRTLLRTRTLPWLKGCMDGIDFRQIGLGFQWCYYWYFALVIHIGLLWFGWTLIGPVLGGPTLDVWQVGFIVLFLKLAHSAISTPGRIADQSVSESIEKDRHALTKEGDASSNASRPVVSRAFCERIVSALAERGIGALAEPDVSYSSYQVHLPIEFRKVPNEDREVEVRYATLYFYDDGYGGCWMLLYHDMLEPRWSIDYETKGRYHDSLQVGSTMIWKAELPAPEKLSPERIALWTDKVLHRWNEIKSFPLGVLR